MSGSRIESGMTIEEYYVYGKLIGNVLNKYKISCRALLARHQWAHTPKESAVTSF